nr:FGGY-family carbohydrate kinase [Saprospiraceae bacterium]
TPIHAMSPLAKIAWLRQNSKEVYGQTAKFISLKEYVLYQFTDEYFIDYSLASATGLFNLKSKKWEEDSLKFAGITADQLSTPVPINFDGFKLKKTMQKSLHLDASTKLIIGSTDGCFATLSTGAMQKDDAIISITSGGAVRVFGKECLTNDKGTFFNYILNDDYYISGGPTSNGGLAFDWSINNIYKNIEDDLDKVIPQLFNELTKVQAGSNGLLFLPYLQGERAPIWDSNARAMFFGLNITHQPIHMIRAVLEGIIFEMFSIAKSILKHRQFNALHVNGVYAATPLWSQIISDVFGMPVSISQYPLSANLGSAMLGLTVMGEYKSLIEASSIIPSPIELNPSVSKHKLYQKLFDIFESLTDKLEEEFRQIAEIQTKN